MWLEFIRYVLLVCGLIYLVTQSAIFVPVRAIVLKLSNLGGVLVFCPSCSGFWIGIGAALLGTYPEGLGFIPGWLESGLVAMALGHVWGVYLGDSGLYMDAVERQKVS